MGPSREGRRAEGEGSRDECDDSQSDREQADGRVFLRIAQGLSLLVLGIWVALLWIPILASPAQPPGDLNPPRIVVTALGGPPFDFAEARGSMFVVAVGVLVCAAASFLLTVRARPGMHPWPDTVGRLWSVGTLFLSFCAFCVLADLLANLPTIMWDAVDEQGLPVFGTVVAEPAAGAWLWAVGSLCLLAAGVCGLLGDHRSRRADSRRPADRGRRADRSEQSKSAWDAEPRITPWPRGNRTYRWARRLPWVAVAAWVLMIWVPIFDSGDHGDDGFRITSLGQVSFGQVPVGPLSLGSLEFVPTLHLAWAVVLSCAATATLFAPFSTWSLVAGLSGSGLLIFEIVLLAHPPRERIWVTDSTAEERSALIVADPAAGIILWTLGGCALLAAGVCGFTSDCRRIERTAQAPTPEEVAARSRRLHSLARFLPFIALAVWIITLFVPVIDSFNDSGPRIIMTSLGDWTPDSSRPPDTFFFVLWVLILTIVVLGIFFASARWWAAAAILLGAFIVVILIGLVLSPPMLMWDGQLPDGTPTGGMEIGYPSVGYGLWLIGGAALITAGICGLLSETQRPRPAVE